MANACVFCGDASRGLTDEHVFSDWITDVFGVRGAPGMNAMGTPGTEDVLHWRGPPMQAVVKVLCAKCNNEWLGARIEPRAKRLLTPMIRGESQLIRSRVQRLLAFWAVKTAFMGDHLQPKNRVVPDSQYRDLRKTEQPSPSHIVWLTHRPAPTGGLDSPLAEYLKEPVRYLVTDNPDEMRKWVGGDHGYYHIEFAIGCVVFQVFGHTVPTPITIEAQPGFPGICIWPIRASFTWPSGPGIAGGPKGMFALHAAFDKPADSRPLPDAPSHDEP
jgi:hypothetical protein